MWNEEIIRLWRRGFLKLKWLKSFLNHIHFDSVWLLIPDHIFPKVGGIYFLLRFNFKGNKLDIKDFIFYQQVLLYWKMIYKHYFIPCIPIWNNWYILSNRKIPVFGKLIFTENLGLFTLDEWQRTDAYLKKSLQKISDRLYDRDVKRTVEGNTVNC